MKKLSNGTYKCQLPDGAPDYKTGDTITARGAGNTFWTQKYKVLSIGPWNDAPTEYLRKNWRLAICERQN